MEQRLIPHLFRTEYRKIATVLCKYFGVEHIEVAEDLAAETFLAALESWPYHGVPPNPVAWLYAVAKNKTRNYQTRNRTYSNKIVGELERDLEITIAEVDLSEQNISDSQLQMLFVLCHPSIPQVSQIGLSLRFLCGFGIDEIANGFLTNKEVINKRLFRAKEKLRQQKIAIEFPAAEVINQRLDTVLTTLYLMFSEGYYSESKNAVIREDFCIEAMRLVQLLLDNESTDTPEVRALYALMCFHASRLKSRKTDSGEMILYADQDESLWDAGLISTGAYYLNKASAGNKLSKYHIEASIAYWHTQKGDSEIKWTNILHLYNKLLTIAYTPIAALNRTYALSRVKGAAVAIEEAEKLQLSNNHFYHMLLAELYSTVNPGQSLQHLKAALSKAKNSSDRKLIQKRMELLETTSSTNRSS